MAALTLAAPTGTAPAASAGGELDCTGADHSNARVMEGTDAHVDPNTVTDAQAAALEKQLQQRLAQFRESGKALPAGKIKVKTYVHVITATDGTGAISNQRIARQLEVINNGFAGRTSGPGVGGKFKFVLKGKDVTANDAWYNWGLNPDGSETNDAIAAKTALHQGTKRDLNIYIAGLSDGLLGYATFPGGPVVRDGLVILNESMPGGGAAPYNKGDTATHEIGHWMGLFHTFQGSCSKKNDRVKDTPAQFAGNNIFECNPRLNTCRSAGKDPVHNFMNYADDKCIDRFTRGQQDRMLRQWKAFRA